MYNDANELTQTEWQNTGTESFGSTSTDGFSYSNSSSTSFVGVTLKETLALNDSVFVSFNASGVTHPDSSDQSPQIRLRDAVDGGSGSSPINQVTNGFNAYTLTYNDGTKSNGNHIVFSEGDTAGGTVTITDFKISRIARNGFVETWYDQSGNDKDMLQAAAASQPSIVKNGGQVKSPNGFPSITFADNAVHLERAEFLTGQLGSYFLVGNTLKADQDGSDAQVVLRQGNHYRLTIELINAGNIRSFIRDNGGDNADARTSSATVGDDDVFLNTTIIGARGSNGIANYFNGGDESTGDTTDVQDVDFTSVDTGNLSFGAIQAGTFDYKGELAEVILFNTNLSSDRTTIETEINNHYNIY